MFETKSYAGKHIYNHQHDGFTQDEGPHVSFTQHLYVRKLFEESVQGEFLEYEIKVIITPAIKTTKPSHSELWGG